MENYFGRLALCLSQGEPVRKVLMIHPISSIWTECRSDRAEDFNHLEMNMGWLDEHITSLNRKGEYYIPDSELLDVRLEAAIDDGYIKDDAYHWQKSKQKIGVFV